MAQIRNPEFRLGAARPDIQRPRYSVPGAETIVDVGAYFARKYDDYYRAASESQV